MEMKKNETPNQYELHHDPEIIVLHTTLGTYESAIEWLTMSPEERQRRTGEKSYSSAHFVIGRLGETTQLAGLDRGTWHAGRISSPSERARRVLRKNIWGSFENPNRYSIGIEVASGYDIDRDGVLESWEKQYSSHQLKKVAELILWIEQKLGKTFPDDHILTHKDIASDKPDLELMRAMVLAELKKLRTGEASDEPDEKQEIEASALEIGATYEVAHKNNKVVFIRQ